MTATGKASPDRNNKPKTSPRSLIWVLGAQALV